MPTLPSTAFPTFRVEASFRQGGGLIRDPIEVLERDEWGLIGQVVVEELLTWNEEEEEEIEVDDVDFGFKIDAITQESSPAAGGGRPSPFEHHPDCTTNDVDASGQPTPLKTTTTAVTTTRGSDDYFPSPSLSETLSDDDDDDDGDGFGDDVTTGQHVMNGVCVQHSMRLQTSASTSVVAAVSVDKAAAGEGNGTTPAASSSFDCANSVVGGGDQTPSLPGTAAAAVWPENQQQKKSGEIERIDDDAGKGDTFNSEADTNTEVYADWKRPLGLRRGTSASAASSDSIEDALRLHVLSINARGGTTTNARVLPSSSSSSSPPLPPVTTTDDGVNQQETKGEQQQRESPTAVLPLHESTTTTTTTMLPLASMPFTVRNAPLLRVIPKFYGIHLAEDRVLLELEDLARWYQHPCIMDIKVGYKTWYPHAAPDYIERCRKKDAATTQAALGFKICGMQVYRHTRGGYWRASKRWCKTLSEVMVNKALTSFAHNEQGLRPADVYGGPQGAVAQLQALASWFELQSEFHLYSASLLILYEGDARGPEEANVRVRLVDFAHTFQTNPDDDDDDDCNGGGGGVDEVPIDSQPPAPQSSLSGIDENFLGGLRAIATRLTAVSSIDSTADTLMTSVA